MSLTEQTKIKLLDLCCGAGGCSFGYKKAADNLGIDIEITGVDIKQQKNYPYKFILGDALEFLKQHGKDFTHIHCSPPCQAFTHTSNKKLKDFKIDPESHKAEMLYHIRPMMYDLGRPGVLENVPGSPLIRDIELKGQMFGLKVIRRRVFETVNWFMMKPGMGRYKGTILHGDYVEIAGKGAKQSRVGVRFKVPGETVREMRSFAMGIDWMTVNEMTEAIPPAYTEYIGEQFLKVR